jgi:hypothetical protein
VSELTAEHDSVKSCSDPCYKLLVETMEMKKSDHVKQLSAKLQIFMESLFKGNTDLPRLVLEYMDSSEIEAQPNCSPNLGLYLDVAIRALGLPALDPQMTDDGISYGESMSVRIALERSVNLLPAPIFYQLWTLLTIHSCTG